MTWATYTIEVAWTGRQTGVFTLGTSTFGGADTLGGAFAGTVFDTISGEVKDIRIRRGRLDELSSVNAGECSLTLKDASGKYNPNNASSPLAGNLKPLRPLRVRATLAGTTYDLFYGFIRSIESDPARDRQEARINAVDLFVWLDAARPVIAATGATTTGAAIGLLLDAIGWTVPSMRALATGDSIPTFSADGSKSALAIIRDLLVAERGIFFINGAGVAVYRERAARAKAVSASTIANTMRAFAPGVDLDALRNRARVTRTAGAQQTAVDEDSRYDYGYRDYEAITTAYLQTDAQALSLAQWLVAQRKEPRSPTRFLALNNGASTPYTALLARELGDRVTVTEALSNTNADFHVEQIEHEIGASGKVHRANWSLTKRGAESWTIGVSTFGGTDVLAY